MSPSQRVLGSFRDPSGFLFTADDGTLYRQINEVYGDTYRHLMDSGLYEDLACDGLLVPHEEEDASLAPSAGAYAVIRPERIPFVSYPYEWCFSQLREAALLTLEIQKRALARGMSLKDGSAFNVQFTGSKAVFIDTLSFEMREEGKPWVAYGQFCRHFLAPLALMSRIDLQMNNLFRAHIDGVPLALAARMLPLRARLNMGQLVHIILHGRAEERQTRSAGSGSRKKVDARVGERGALGILNSLRSTVTSLDCAIPDSEWSGYYGALPYTGEAAQDKRDIVGAFLDEVRPETVWDLGANTGEFCALAMERGAYAIAMERDASCVEGGYRATKGRDNAPLMLRVDLGNPSPSLGWAHSERESLVERGPACIAMALALIHHLCIGNNVPLPDAARFFASICRRLIIEFVPKEDPMVQKLLESKPDVFPGYSQPGFLEAFEKHFTVEQSRLCKDSKRTLYLLRAKG